MNRLYIREPVSGGILLSYKCTSECKHCMYSCSPRWKADWISEGDVESILTQLADKIQESPFGSKRIGIHCGLHFTGGEPFLNFGLLLEMVKKADELEIPSTFVETNCFWCTDDETTREKLTKLKDAGLNGILISVNPFILEQIPFERTEKAVRISREIFDRDVMTYQEFFYDQFKRLEIKNTVTLEEYLRKAPDSLSYVELLPMGRAPFELGHLYRKFPAKQFFDRSCKEELTREWHVHIDNYGNYMTGYCGGISLGDARNLDSMLEGIDLDERPILDALVTDLRKLLRKLYEFAVKEFRYEEDSEGYISKCHLCVDVIRHIAQQTNEFKELRPREFYYFLSART